MPLDGASEASSPPRPCPPSPAPGLTLYDQTGRPARVLPTSPALPKTIYLSNFPEKNTFFFFFKLDEKKNLLARDQNIYRLVGFEISVLAPLLNQGNQALLSRYISKASQRAFSTQKLRFKQ